MRAGKRLGLPVVPSRLAILTKPLNGRAACFYATPCGRGCAIRANFQSTTVLIPPALDTGNLDPGTSSQPMAINVPPAGDPYHCSIHPVMVGNIVPAAAGTTPGY